MCGVEYDEIASVVSQKRTALQPWTGHRNVESGMGALSLVAKHKHVTSGLDTESEAPCRRSRRNGNIAPEDIPKIRNAFLQFRFQLYTRISLCIKQDLLEGEPASSDSFDILQSGKWSYGTMCGVEIDEIASMVSEEKREAVLCKWYGESERDQMIGEEVLEQLEFDMHHSPFTLDCSKSLLRCWNLDRDSLSTTWTADDAKDLCNAFHAPLYYSEAYHEAISPEELTYAAKRMVDVLKKHLKPWSSFWGRMQ